MADLMTLDGLSPEEIAALEAKLAERKQHAEDPISALSSVLQFVLDQVEDFGSRLGKLETDFYQKVLGGIDGLYKEGLRADGMKAFMEKHGPTFQPFAEDFKRIFDSDLFEKAYDYLESLKGEEGYTDEAGAGKIAELVDQLKARLGKPAAVSVEVAKTEPAKPEEKPEETPAVPAEEGDLDAEKAYDEIAAMKRRDEARAAHRKGAA